MQTNDDALARAYDVILQRAKQELEQLKDDVRAKESFIVELMKQRQSERSRVASDRARAENGNGATPSGSTWADRVDSVLASKKGDKLTPAQIAAALGATAGQFPNMRVSASTLIRATLRREGAAEKYGWKSKKVGINVFWWKDAG